MRARSMVASIQVYWKYSRLVTIYKFSGVWRRKKSGNPHYMHVTGANLGKIAYKDRLRAFRSAACTKFWTSSEVLGLHMSKLATPCISKRVECIFSSGVYELCLKACIDRHEVGMLTCQYIGMVEIII
jgi:hypothetical protein